MEGHGVVEGVIAENMGSRWSGGGKSVVHGGGHCGVEGVKVKWKGSSWSGGGHGVVEGVIVEWLCLGF